MNGAGLLMPPAPCTPKPLYPSTGPCIPTHRAEYSKWFFFFLGGGGYFSMCIIYPKGIVLVYSDSHINYQNKSASHNPKTPVSPKTFTRNPSREGSSQGGDAIFLRNGTTSRAGRSEGASVSGGCWASQVPSASKPTKPPLL